MKYIAFDLEVAKPIPPGETDWRRHRPLGVTCAATLAEDDDRPQLFYSLASGQYAPTMTRGDLGVLVKYLRARQNAGYTIVTWNGLAFDFDVLAEESGMHDACADLALAHVDMMFQIFCLRGHYLGLNKAARGLGLPGKTEGMTGADAPATWASGEHEKVLEYLAQDVRTTLQVAQAVERRGLVRWTSASGRVNTVGVDKWLTVAEAQRLPAPDTSWMTKPVSREQFTAWVGHHVQSSLF